MTLSFYILYVFINHQIYIAWLQMISMMLMGTIVPLILFTMKQG